MDTLTSTSLAALKKSLFHEFAEVASSHLSEAVAYSLGYRTHAALLAALPAVPPQDAPYALLNSERMLERLAQLGYPPDPEFDFESLMKPAPEVVSTMHVPSSYEIELKTVRQRAWRNLMVCAVNAGLDQGLFTLRPGDNRFGRGRLFDFALPNGLPALGWVDDANFDELTVRAAVHPKGDWVRLPQGGFDAGEAHGETWVERRLGFWMQSSHSLFNCRKPLLQVLAGLDVTPKGFGDRGRVIM